MFDKIELAMLDELHFKFDEATQLRSIIAIHNTRLGPALGGCRCIEYSNDDAAITDVIKLARGMSYKAALAKVPQGGGKGVILKPPVIADRVALYRAFGKFINDLGGRYITAVDSGTLLADMDEVASITPYVSGTSKDGSNPSPLTALGVFAGIKAAVRQQLQLSSVAGLRIAIQGLGNVGYLLAGLLHKEGALMFVCDPDEEKVQRCVKEFGAVAVSTDAIYDVDCDVFSPCGLGGILNEQTLPRLRCRVVAGAANNQLADDQQGEILHLKGILYAPDYVINAGGLISVSLGYLKAPADTARLRTLALGDTLAQLFERSKVDNCPPEQIANHMAEEILYH